MEAIKTTYTTYADLRGTCLQASCEDRSVIVKWDFTQGTEDNHRTAACKLVETVLGKLLKLAHEQLPDSRLCWSLAVPR